MTDPLPPSDSTRPMARLFVAVPLAAAPREALARLSNNLQKGFQFTPCRPSWGHPETIHVTLAFLGQKPRAMIDPIREALRQVAGSFAPLVIEIKGLGVFPNWQRPRVLWAGLRERTHQIEALHQAVERCLERFDYEPEEREYRPHLTLARFGGLRGVNAAQGIVMAHKDFRAPTFDAPACVLFESELHPSGARHTPLDHFEFTKPSDSSTRESSTI
jgi:RNA 2',3'-cyclic 3'-phosphodiesterase